MHRRGTLGDFVTAERGAAGLTQEELSEKSGLSVRTIRDIERGRVRKPHPATVRSLAAALRLDDSSSRKLHIVASRLGVQ